MVCRGDDRKCHRGRHDDGEDADHRPARGLEKNDAQEEVPAGMEAREGGVLVRQGRRLERPVPARVFRHRVDEPRIGQPRWGNGERCEEDKPD